MSAESAARSVGDYFSFYREILQSKFIKVWQNMRKFCQKHELPGGCGPCFYLRSDLLAAVKQKVFDF